MTETLDAPIADIADIVSAIDDPREFYRASREAESRVTTSMRAARRERLLALKEQGLTWRQIGELLGVSTQRAEQLSREI